MKSPFFEIISKKPFVRAKLRHGEMINDVLRGAISTDFGRLIQGNRKSHYFEKRYENIYFEIDEFKGFAELVQAIKALLPEVLLTEPIEKIHELNMGFWLNAMGPGHVTSLHSHDDFSEKLSAVYYVQVPVNSGEFCYLDAKGNKKCLIPEAGECYFFLPELEHEVSKNKSNEQRLSIAFNFCV